MKTLELEVQGMSCGHCVASVEKALKAVQGVQDVQVNLSAGRATVSGTPEVQALLAAVQEEGYSAQVAGAA